MPLTEKELEAIRREAEEKYPNTMTNGNDIYHNNDMADAKQEAHIAALTAERERVSVLKDMVHKVINEYFEKYMPEKINTSDEKQLGMYTSYWFLKDALNQYNNGK